jgi:autotransporter-associated beta strand protein
MKRFLSHLVAAIVVTAGSSATTHAQGTLYWDTNGAEPGAGTNSPEPGFTDGIWGTDNFWSADPNGAAATAAWTPGDHAVFSAGTDAMDAFIDVTGTQTAASVTIEEGMVTFGTGTVDTGAGPVNINAGATLNINSTLRLNTTSGKVVLNGGTLMQTNPSSAGSFIGSGAGGKGLEINGTGFIGYDDGDGVPDNKVAIFFGVISGVGGTVDNGGAGTLVKVGPDQIGVGVSSQGGQHSQSLFTFAKLEVREGAYRLRHQTLDTTVKETAFGAVPLAELPDAITLNGGGIGSNTTVTLHANRGITIGPNGGYFDNGAGAGLSIPGPLSGSGTLMVGSPTTTATSNVTFTLSHPNNVNTFTGDVAAIRGVLQLNSSLTAADLKTVDPAPGPAPGAATISVAAGQTFTFGSGGENTTFNGNVRGAGTWRKVGSGTTTITGTVAGNTHSGDTRVEGGTLSIANPYLANGGDIYLSTGAALNLMFTGNDTIDELFIDGMGQQMGLWGAEGNMAAQFTTPLLTGTGLLDVTTGPPVGLPGDYNEDGIVDAADYVVWRKTDGSQPGYDDWRMNFGRTAGSGSGSSLNPGAVPEPSAIALVILGISAAAFARRNR